MLLLLFITMNSFMSYGLHQAYDRLAKLGDPLAEVNTLLDWKDFDLSQKSCTITRPREEVIPTSIVY
jgi:hypothetical protein